MESIPKKGYFAKELALRTLFGDKAFADLKKLMDPCCGPGVDGLCTEPCGSTPTDMCPELVITAVSIDCAEEECSLTVVSTNTGGATICGEVQLRLTFPVPIPITLSIAADQFCVTGDTTTVLNLPFTCQMFSEGIFDGDFPLVLSNIMLVPPGLVSSNEFPNGQIVFDCPFVRICTDDEGIFENCPQINCTGINYEGIISLTAFQTSGTLEVQVRPSGTTGPWTLVDTVTGYNNNGTVSTNITFDASSLQPGDCYEVRLVDAADPSIAVPDDDTINFCMPPVACPDPIVIEDFAATFACIGTPRLTNVVFNYDLNGTFVIEAMFSTGVWTTIFTPGPLVGPGTYSNLLTGPLSASPGTPGNYAVRVRETGGGSVSNQAIINFTACP